MAGRIEALIPVPAPERVDRLEGLIRRVVDDLDAGRECDALILQIDAEAGAPGYDRNTFFELYSWTDERDFAELAVMGRPPALFDLTVSEIMECLGIIEAGKQPRCSFCLGILERSFPHLSVVDMIFYPENELSIAELALEILRSGAEGSPLLP